MESHSLGNAAARPHDGTDDPGGPRGWLALRTLPVEMVLDQRYRVGSQRILGRYGNRFLVPRTCVAQRSGVTLILDGAGRDD